MKRLYIFLAFLFAFTMQATAQQVGSIPKGITARMAYCDYKDLYDSKDYVHVQGEPYSPVGSGIASFFIPGLGQVLNGQAGKGIGMFFGDVLLVTGAIVVGSVCTGKATAGVLICLSGALAIDIWSICDAVHVAKIKDLYYRDCERLYGAVDVKLFPSITLAQTGQGLQPAAGMTLAMRF